MSTNASPALARERDNFADPADLESADPALGDSEIFSEAFVAEIRKRANTPRSKNRDRDDVVARVMATIDSYKK